MIEINALIDSNSNLMIRFFDGTKVGDKYCATGRKGLENVDFVVCNN